MNVPAAPAVKTTGKLLAVSGATVIPAKADTLKYAAPGPSLVTAVINRSSVPKLVTVNKFVAFPPAITGPKGGPVT